MNFNTRQLRELAEQHTTPTFIYSREILRTRAEQLAGLSLPFGYVPRYAVKANTHPEIIRIFDEAGIAFDASSSYEAQVLLDRGIAGDKISLSSQQPAHNLVELLDAKVEYVATSLHQLELFISAAKSGTSVGLRVNPGMGTGYNNRLTTGGPNASFGLWHEYVPQALRLAKEHGVSIDKLHVHVGTGADPKVWDEVIRTAVSIAKMMPDVEAIDIGGGYKIHYFGDDQETDMESVMAVFSNVLTEFEQETGRKLRLEIEPGKWLVAHGGVLLAEIVDIVDTGKDGHIFLRLNTGMNDFIRASMYGAQHRIEVLNDATETADYIVVGHNCETGDILTPAPGNPEELGPRRLNKAAIGDAIAIYDTGAYCASFSVHGYNAFPDAKEIMV